MWWYDDDDDVGVGVGVGGDDDDDILADGGDGNKKAVRCDVDVPPSKATRLESIVYYYYFRRGKERGTKKKNKANVKELDFS